jgi:hypothetical protein
MSESSRASVSRVVEAGGREATVLEHETLRVMIDDTGGMIPELSGKNGGGDWINAHWMPWFRANSGKPYSDAEYGSFWKSEVMYNIAGNFPCIPNLGPGHIINGVHIPPNGWTANQNWRYVTNDIDEASGAVWALSVMESPDKAMPLSFSKIDALIPGQSAHYASIRVRNRGVEDIEICAAWHNTLGSPFFGPGCRISGSAKRWMTVVPGGEFDTTSRLALGAEFDSLAKAPLLRGGKADISVVPPPNGYTDFTAGAVPHYSALGWLSLVNPQLRMAYVSFFTGPAAAEEEEIILYFNNLWMQYGGRPYTPHAAYEGGPDLTYCLGLEASVSAWAYGLEFSREQNSLLGSPTTVKIPAMRQKTMRQGTLLAPYNDALLDEGIGSIEPGETRITAAGKAPGARMQGETFAADPSFRILKTLEKHHV